MAFRWGSLSYGSSLVELSSSSLRVIFVSLTWKSDGRFNSPELRSYSLKASFIYQVGFLDKPEEQESNGVNSIDQDSPCTRELARASEKALEEYMVEEKAEEADKAVERNQSVVQETSPKRWRRRAKGQGWLTL